MAEFVLIVDVAYFFEAVHVELADKGAEILMFKGMGKDFSAEFVLILDDESVSGVVETDDALIAGVLTIMVNNIAI